MRDHLSLVTDSAESMRIREQNQVSFRRIVSVDVVLHLCSRFHLTCTQILLQDDSSVVSVQASVADGKISNGTDQQKNKEAVQVPVFTSVQEEVGTQTVRIIFRIFSQYRFGPHLRSSPKSSRCLRHRTQVSHEKSSANVTTNL